MDFETSYRNILKKDDKMKFLSLFAILIIFPGLAHARVTKVNLTQDEIRQQEKSLNSSPVLKGLAKGIERQYNHRCEKYRLESFSGDDSTEGIFVAKLVCVDKRPGMENTGKIITVEGDVVPGSPMGVYNIKIDNAG